MATKHGSIKIVYDPIKPGFILTYLILVVALERSFSLGVPFRPVDLRNSGEEHCRWFHHLFLDFESQLLSSVIY